MALMILLTFPGDFKDSSWFNQISVASLSPRLGSLYAASLSGVCFLLWFGDEETLCLSAFRMNENTFARPSADFM